MELRRTGKYLLVVELNSRYLFLICTICAPQSITRSWGIERQVDAQWAEIVKKGSGNRPYIIT